ncbi:uncharacterized protein [Choristoneura fumiferana]|uniref:uncharacterized protein n=1 Tax=Choristoneura fumiferana TaxID=7141 RepID=UPI003D153837
MNLLCYFYIIILLNNLLVLGQEEKHVFRLSDKLLRCSSNLSKVIQEFCDNVHKVVKRDTSVIIDKLVPGALHIHMKRERLKRWHRVRRQVATECCERACTVSNILLYCPDDAEVLRDNQNAAFLTDLIHSSRTLNKVFILKLKTILEGLFVTCFILGSSLNCHFCFQIK